MGALDNLKKGIGKTGKVIDAGIALAERDLVKSADSGVPVVSQLGKVLQPAAVGIRAAVAKATSGGGEYYQPEVRDGRYFSKDAKRQIAGALEKNGDQYVERYDYKADAAGLEVSQALGGASVKDGKLTDVFDVDREDPYGLVTGLRETAATYAGQGKIAKAVAFGTLGNLAEMGHRALGTVFGGGDDPDKGKVRTEIPLTELKKYRQASKGGNTSGESDSSSALSGHNPALDGYSGPRIVINPSTFRNEKDAMCVAFNERFRIWMEANGFSPKSEPTKKQRAYFADTAYADDEVMLRRTILARIASLDTSVEDPTDQQIAETLEMLKGFKETERSDDAWQAEALDRIIGLVQAVEPTVPAAQGAGGTASAAAQ